MVKTAKKGPYLRYKGGGFLPGVPARDMTIQEAQKAVISFLVKQGMYELVRPPRRKAKSTSTEGQEVIDDGRS